MVEDNVDVVKSRRIRQTRMSCLRLGLIDYFFLLIEYISKFLLKSGIYKDFFSIAVFMKLYPKEIINFL